MRQTIDRYPVSLIAMGPLTVIHQSRAQFLLFVTVTSQAGRSAWCTRYRCCPSRRTVHACTRVHRPSAANRIYLNETENISKTRCAATRETHTSASQHLLAKRFVNVATLPIPHCAVQPSQGRRQRTQHPITHNTLTSSVRAVLL